MGVTLIPVFCSNRSASLGHALRRSLAAAMRMLTGRAPSLVTPPQPREAINTTNVKRAPHRLPPFRMTASRASFIMGSLSLWLIQVIASYDPVDETVNQLGLPSATELVKTRRSISEIRPNGEAAPRMKLEYFLQHHGIAGNPFAEEDAQTDTVFKRRCLASVHHPAWNKFFGSPVDPSTALVFGEKGSGKTALRLQAESELESHNQANPLERVFVISYDDFNPFLDNCKTSLGASKLDDVLEKWRLEDHMDAILSLGVTKLVDLLNAERVNLTTLSVDQRRDLLLLAALYDASTKAPIAKRWSRLRRQSGFRSLWSRRDLQIGFGTTLVVIALIAAFPSFLTLKVIPWLLVPILGGWLYWGWRLIRAEWFARDIRRGQRVLSRDPAALRWELLWFKPLELGGQPLPRASSPSSEERYGVITQVSGDSPHAWLCRNHHPHRSR